jgi:hypothetical protein
VIVAKSGIGRPESIAACAQVGFHVLAGEFDENPAAREYRLID